MKMFNGPSFDLMTFSHHFFFVFSSSYFASIREFHPTFLDAESSITSEPEETTRKGKVSLSLSLFFYINIHINILLLLASIFFFIIIFCCCCCCCVRSTSFEFFYFVRKSCWPEAILCVCVCVCVCVFEAVGGRVGVGWFTFTPGAEPLDGLGALTLN